MTTPTSTATGSTPAPGPAATGPAATGPAATGPAATTDAAAAAADGGVDAAVAPAGTGQLAAERVEPERARRFREDVAQLRIVEPRARREAALLRLGVLLLVVGVALGVVGYLTSHGTTNPLEQRDGMVIALIGISVSVAGAAFFLRYSMAAFLRFWLARLLFEQQYRHTGVGAASSASSASSAEPPAT